jgi:GH24 family phage-related lysozyme (muramidase)
MEPSGKDDFIAGLHIGKDVLPSLTRLHKKLASALKVWRRHRARFRSTRSGLSARRRDERWWNKG